MEYFLLLDRETVEDLRRDFRQAEAVREEGIDIYIFVRTLLKYWPVDNLDTFVGNAAFLTHEIVKLGG
jgi:hypothetical protein